MNRLRYLLQSLNVLNALLAATIAVIAIFVMMPMQNPDIRSLLPSVKNKAIPAPAQPATQARPPVLDYVLISDQNIFHPERKIPPEKKEEKAIPRPEVILYGTLITEQLSVAFVEDKKAPRTTQGRGKRQIALHKGEQLSGYILKEITANSIVLTKGEEKIVVLLEEGDKRKAVESPSAQAMQSAQPAAVHLPAAVQKNVQTPPYQQPAATQKNVPTSPYQQPAAAQGQPGSDFTGVRSPGRRNAAQLEALKRKDAARRQMETQ